MRKLLCLLAFFSISFSFLAAQGCPTPANLSKDSTSVTAVYYSWSAVPGARAYKVTYTTPSDTLSQLVGTNTVNFTKPINTEFEIFTVTTICGNGDESEPAGLIDGGIVVTVDIIFRMADDCNDPLTSPDPNQYLFFSDLCMYTQADDICRAIDEVNTQNPLNPSQDPEDWLKLVLDELGSGVYLWEPWESDECQEPLRLQKPVLSQLKVGPNPFNKSFIAHYYQENPGQVSLSIIDVMGRIVERHAFTATFSGEQRISGLGETLSPGMYFLRIQSEGRQLLINILKQE